MMNRKAVFVIGQWSDAGGLEVVTRQYIDVFYRFGFEVVVYAANGAGQNVVKPKFSVFHVEPSNRILKSLWHRGMKFWVLARKVQKVLKDGDVLIIGHPFLMPIFQYAKLSTKVIRWVWTHGIDAWGDRPKEWGKWQHELTRVVAVSNYTAQQERQNGITRPISVISNSVNTDCFVPTDDVGKIRRNEILISSRLSPDNRNKGHDILFAAVPQVEKILHRTVHVRVVGGGADLDYVKAIAEKTCPGRVEVMGRVSAETLLDCYQHCAVFCLPSRVEYVESTNSWRGDGFGLVYAEAQACGRPVVGSIEGGAVDPILEGVTGYKVDPRSAMCVAEAIAKILSNPGFSDEMGRAARKFVVQNFSPLAYRNRIAGVLLEDGIDVQKIQ